MNKLFFAALFLGGFVVLYGVGRAWKLKPENKLEHRLLRGETAVATIPGGGRVWLAVDQGGCSSLNVAMARKDAAHLQACEDNQTAFAIPAGAFVKVTGESVSHVKVEVLDGPQAGRTGWVEFQYLRPPRPGERR